MEYGFHVLKFPDHPYIILTSLPRSSTVVDSTTHRSELCLDSWQWMGLWELVILSQPSKTLSPTLVLQKGKFPLLGWAMQELLVWGIAVEIPMLTGRSIVKKRHHGTRPPCPTDSVWHNWQQSVPVLMQKDLLLEYPILQKQHLWTWAVDATLGGAVIWTSNLLKKGCRICPDYETSLVVLGSCLKFGTLGTQCQI